MALSHRKFLATLLLVAVLVVGFPAVGITGGCDEPGYTGGSCGRSSGSDTGDGTAPVIPGEEPGTSGTSGGGTTGLIAPSTGLEVDASSDGFFFDLGRILLNLVLGASIF